MLWSRRPKVELESRAALADAKKNLQVTRERTTEVSEVSNSLRRIRENNHFAEKLGVIMGGKQ